ncbi:MULTISPECIES: response regulator [Streptomyces]|uniref:Response regulator transcription factor n=1 Tax=Streptomyces morookaense TaxID=1970 RepID=A0A7Y7B8K2_STRMO|nr:MULTISPECIES: response regulator transcription factor [Streptomyces]MCC2280350.1 response regulator transcription factor [Streptomyces sp. ET3-23]NVK80576.1 response regulator transcription factor [Streptomyces morookaense]GHF53874.1 DNA-binding response regulator [Streptomyces morookaense]
MTVTVLVADDEEITRTGLRTLLGARPGLDVIGEAADGLAAVTLAEQLRPDVVLMDVRMPGADGIEATRRLQTALPDPPKVVVITTFENDDHVYDALRAGASGFVLKRAAIEHIAHAVQLVATTDSVLFPDAVRRLVAARPAQPRPPRGAPALTGRELEILRLMATGLSNPGIAGHLVVGLETVKTHVSNLLAKLGARNRTQAVILAYEYGFVVPGTGPVMERGAGDPGR